jgi:hypothetical protein
LTCAQVNKAIGCCEGNVLYYCDSGATTPTTQTCSGTKLCGWNANELYYGCITVDGGTAPSDPTDEYPLACP